MNETNIGVRVGATPEPLTAAARRVLHELSIYKNNDPEKYGFAEDIELLARAALEGGVSPQQGWNEGFVKGHAMASEIRDIGEALVAARAKFGLEGGVHQTESAGEAVQRPVGRRVVCAALRASDGRVLLGIRHYSKDMHEQIARRDDRLRFEHLHDPDQGFVDQFGVYMTREEAYAVAAAAGQIVRPGACGTGLDGAKLYSEGLY